MNKVNLLLMPYVRTCVTHYKPSLGLYNEDWFNNNNNQHFYPSYSSSTTTICTAENNTEVSSLDTPDILSDNHIIIPHMYFDPQPSPSTFYSSPSSHLTVSCHRYA